MELYQCHGGPLRSLVLALPIVEPLGSSGFPGKRLLLASLQSQQLQWLWIRVLPIRLPTMNPLTASPHEARVHEVWQAPLRLAQSSGGRNEYSRLTSSAAQACCPRSCVLSQQKREWPRLGRGGC